MTTDADRPGADGPADTMRGDATRGPDEPASRAGSAARRMLASRAMRVTLPLAALAVLAFAGNSLLTRAALADGSIDAYAFTGIRLVSGALALAAILAWRKGRSVPRRADLPGILALLLYAVFFTLAYLRLGAATGALILFGMVQVTMVGVSLARGHRPSATEWIGLGMALAGLAWLLGPSLTAPSRWAALSMAAAGIAWGAYTLIGRGAREPLAQTARMFVGTAPIGLALIALGLAGGGHASGGGVALAVASGAVTSGIGYAIWYAALPGMSAMLAGVSQLLVPAVAALGAAIWLREPITPTLLAASLLILLGIGVTLRPASKGT